MAVGLCDSQLQLQEHGIVRADAAHPLLALLAAQNITASRQLAVLHLVKCSSLITDGEPTPRQNGAVRLFLFVSAVDSLPLGQQKAFTNS